MEINNIQHNKVNHMDNNLTNSPNNFMDNNHNINKINMDNLNNKFMECNTLFILNKTCLIIRKYKLSFLD